MKKLFLTTFFLACIALYTSAQAPIKKVLLEEFTTASCGNCPPMSNYVNLWQIAHSANSIVMTIHEGSGNDAMSNNLTDAIFNAMHPTGSWFAPAMMINRAVYPSTGGEAYLSCYNSWGSGTGIGVDTIATRLISEPADVGVEISGTYNATTRVINATVNATFVTAMPTGDWRINLFLVEDSVVGYPNLGAFAGWDQHCYDANWANTHYPGMFDGTSIIGYPHRHVMRSSFFGNWGVAGVIPAVPVVGTTYSSSAALTIDTAYKDHFSLVAFVSSYGSLKTQKFVLNANSVELGTTFTTGISTPQAVSSLSFDNISPQPTAGQTKMVYTLNKQAPVVIEIADITGKTVKQLLAATQTSGKHELTFDASHFSKGMYFVVLKSGDSSVVKKMVVE